MKQVIQITNPRTMKGYGHLVSNDEVVKRVTKEGGVWVADVQHEDGCALMNALPYCNCFPDVTMKLVRP